MNQYLNLHQELIFILKINTLFQLELSLIATRRVCGSAVFDVIYDLSVRQHLEKKKKVKKNKQKLYNNTSGNTSTK